MRQRLFFSINCECLTVSRLLTAASCTSGHNRRAEAKAYYLHGPDFRFIISDRLTKGRPKSFEDIGYRSIRCLICVETWTSTSSIIDNRSVIRPWFRRSWEHATHPVADPYQPGRRICTYVAWSVAESGSAHGRRKIFPSPILSLKMLRDIKQICEANRNISPYYLIVWRNYNFTKNNENTLNTFICSIICMSVTSNFDYSLNKWKINLIVRYCISLVTSNFKNIYHW